MKLKRMVLVPVALAMLAIASTALAQSAHSSAAKGAVVSTKHTSLGTILVTGSGQTLYLDANDKPGHSACTGQCLVIWPPLKSSGAPKATGGAKAADLGTIKGTKQVTYKGHPLYTFKSDSTSNPVSGEGVNSFFVVSPAGAKIAKPVTKTTTSSTSTSTAYGY